MKTSVDALQMTKMQGAGNSFLITSQALPIKSRPAISKHLCNPHFGVGADGMVFINSKKDGNFEWDFYNSDGSEAEFCGNAARCVALFLFHQHPEDHKIEIKTRAGLVRCEVQNDHTVQVEMPKAKWLSKSLAVPLWPMPVAWLNTGVPHIVVEVKTPEELTKYKSEAAHIRSWEKLGPGGSNVTFIFKHAKDLVSAITFERGVEDFTLACGTGAVAAAILMMEQEAGTQCSVQMPGGSLDISLNQGKVFMKGEAFQIAELTSSLVKDLT